MTLYEAAICWLIINEIFIIWRLEVYRLEAKD